MLRVRHGPDVYEEGGIELGGGGGRGFRDGEETLELDRREAIRVIKARIKSIERWRYR